MIRAVLTIAVLAVACAAGTVLAGWWTLPLIGLGAGAALSDDRPVGVVAGVAAGLAWGGILAWTATQGPVGALADRVGSVFGAPGPVLFLLAIAFSILAAGSAAVVGQGVRRRLRSG